MDAGGGNMAVCVDVSERGSATKVDVEQKLLEKTLQELRMREQQLQREKLHWLKQEHAQLKRMRALQPHRVAATSERGGEAVSAATLSANASPNATGMEPESEKQVEQQVTNVAKLTSTDVFRTKQQELKDLQQRALTVMKKHQEAKAAMEQKINDAKVAKDAVKDDAVKRKRSDGGGNVPVIDTTSPAPPQHLWSRQTSSPVHKKKKKEEEQQLDLVWTVDLQVSTRAQLASLGLRIATRYFLQHHRRMPLDLLHKKIQTVTGSDDELTSEQNLRSLTNDYRLGEFVTPHGDVPGDAPALAWRPGTKFAPVASFATAHSGVMDETVHRKSIRAYLELEKQVVRQLCHSVENMEADTAEEVLLSSHRFTQFRRLLRHTPVVTHDGWSVVSLCVGNQLPKLPAKKTARPTACYLEELSDMFAEMAKLVETVASRNNELGLGFGESERGTLDRPRSSGSRPFSLEQDSVLPQLKSRNLKIDPMKVLCLFELNGVCNDEHCPHLHERDFSTEANCTVKTPSPTAARDGTLKLLRAFVCLLQDEVGTWPLLMGRQKQIAEPAKPDAVQVDTSSTVDTTDSAEEEEDGFLTLEVDSMEADEATARYYEDSHAGEGIREQLEGVVAMEPNNVDAWIQLALEYLELEIDWVEETTRLSSAARLCHQLSSLRRNLDQRSMLGQHVSSLKDTNLRKSLNVLARALEVESNVDSEPLWILYLRLYGFVSKSEEEQEVDMVERAFEHLPYSARLWLHYMSCNRLDSITVVDALYSRALQHLASQPDCTELDSLSQLLADLLFQLCVRLIRANRRQGAVHLLQEFLGMSSGAAGLEWCQVVAEKLVEQDLIIVALVYAHVVLFEHVPEGVECCIGSGERSNVNFLAYATSSLDEIEVENGQLAKISLLFESYCKNLGSIDQLHPYIDVILSNWIVVKSRFTDNDDIQPFLTDLPCRAQRFPRASHTIALFIKNSLQQFNSAAIFFKDAILEADRNVFPSLLYYFLLYQRESLQDTEVSRSLTIDLLDRLGQQFEDFAADDVSSIFDDDNPFTKAKSIKRYLYGILTRWMDGFQALEVECHSVNAFIGMDVVLLLSELLDSNAAIDALKVVMNSSKFCFLPFEHRQRFWILRILLLKPASQSSTAMRDSCVELSRLVHDYMKHMSAVSEFKRSRYHKLQRAVRCGVQAAVRECLRIHPRVPDHVEWQLFELCTSALSKSQRASFTSSFAKWLTPCTAYCKSIVGGASLELESWETRRILKRHLAIRGMSYDPAILKALILLELQQHGVKLAADTLQRCLQLDPLVAQTWEVAVGLEILFGDDNRERTKAFAHEIHRTSVNLEVNMFGDQDLKKECGAHNSPSLLLSARSLYGVPCSIFLRSPLRELDLSGNCLIDIPPAIGSLSHLEVLNISQNALLQVPAAVSNLAELKVLNLSHNNIKSLPASLFESMKKLSVLDLRVNLLTHLPVSVVKLSSLRVLMVAHNFIKWSHAEVATRQLTCTVDINQTKSTIPLCASPKAPNTRRNDDDAQKEKQRDQQVVSRDTHTVTALTITSENAKSDDEAEVSMVEAVESTSITSAVAVAAEEAQVSTEPAASKGSDAEGASQHGDATEDAAVRTAPAAPTSSDTNISQQPSPVNADETNDVTMESADIVEESKEEESELEEDGFMIVEPPQQQQRSSSNRHVEDDSSAAASPTRSTSSAATSELSAFEQVKKLMEDQKKSRAQIKRDHPELWRQFAEQSFLFYTSLGNCALCGCSNDDGKNQRLNTMVLCPDCLAVGLDVLRSKSTKPVHRSLW